MLLHHRTSDVTKCQRKACCVLLPTSSLHSGTGNGTTAYNENIGAMQITRVGSRRVVQVGAIIAVIFGLIGATAICAASRQDLAVAESLLCLCA